MDKETGNGLRAGLAGNAPWDRGLTTSVFACERSCQGRVQAVGTAIGEHLGLGQACQGQVPQQVQQLMANWFVGKAQGWIQPVVSVANQGIVQGATLNQAGRPQLLHLLTKTKGAGRGYLLHEQLWTQLQRKQLPADRRLLKFNRRPDR